MLRSLLRSLQVGQPFCFRLQPQAFHLNHLWPAAAQGPGFIQEDHFHPFGILQCRSVPYQYSGLGAPPHPGDDRRGSGQPHGAGTGDDQYRNRVDQGEGEGWSPLPPCNQSDECYGQNCRDELPGNAVGQKLNGYFRALCFANQPYHVCQHGCLADPLRLHKKGSLEIDRSGGDAIADGLVFGYRFSGNHRFVDGRSSLQEEAIDGNPFSRTDAKNVAGKDLLDGRPLFHSIP